MDSQVKFLHQGFCFCKDLNRKYPTVIDGEIRNGDRSSFYMCLYPGSKCGPIDTSDFSIGDNSNGFNRVMPPKQPEIILKMMQCIVHV